MRSSSSSAWSAYDGEWGAPVSPAVSAPYITHIPHNAVLKNALGKKELLQRGSQGVVYTAYVRGPHNCSPGGGQETQPPLVAVKRLFTRGNDFGRHGLAESVLREATILHFVGERSGRGGAGVTENAEEEEASAPQKHRYALDETARPVKLLRILEAPHNELCLVMELCTSDLRRIVIQKRANPLGLYGGDVDGPVRCPTLSQPALLRYLLRRLLRLVAFLHSDCRVLHRDIKLSNFLVTRDGGLRLSDFGSARFMHGRNADSERGANVDTPPPATSGDGCGAYTPSSIRTTLLYQAPECLLWSAPYSTAVDVWALGVVFAEMVLQRHLFKANSELAMIGAIHKLLGPSASLTERAEQPPPELLFEEQQSESADLSQQQGTLPLKFPESLLPAEGLDLLQRMLQANPAGRITVDDALRHSFLHFPTEDSDDDEGRALWLAKVESVAREQAAEQAPRVRMPTLAFSSLSGNEDDDEERENSSDDMDVMEPPHFNIRLS